MGEPKLKFVQDTLKTEHEVMNRYDKVESLLQNIGNSGMVNSKHMYIYPSLSV